MRASLLLVSLLIFGCAAQIKEPSGNEKALREWYPGKWDISCRDLKSGQGEAPFLAFTILEPDRIVDLHFVYSPSPRYDEHAIPHGDLHGPFHGEKVVDGSSPYEGAYDYKITDRFHLFLPALKPGFETEVLARDRDSMKQNGAVELEVNGQPYDSILHLRCQRP